MNRIKLVLIAMGTLVLLLWLMNPNIKDFEQFIPTRASSPNKTKLVTSKISDYIIYSVYEYELYEQDEYEVYSKTKSGQFNGFMKNFYEIRTLTYNK